MRRMKFAVLTLTILLILCACGVRETITPSASASETPFEETSSTAWHDQSQLESPADPEDEISESAPSEGSNSIVYFTSDISAEGLIRIYKALGWEPQVKPAVKSLRANLRQATIFVPS